MADAAKPSDLEMQVLSILWDRGPSTARQILDAMPDGKKRAYTTILSVMQVMEKKGLLTHTSKGLAHLYKPAVSKSKIIRPFVRRMVTNVFGGKPSTLVQTLLSETNVNPKELAQIQKLLDDAASAKAAKTKKGKKR